MAERTCSIPDCPDVHFGRGWCKKHYQRWYRNGDPLDPGSRLVGLTSVERFWRYTDKQGRGGCWLWRGTILPNGYGMFGNDKGRQGAHRFAYELLVAPIPEGLHLDHLCRVRACVNPAHLEPVTVSENQLRGASSALQRHCPKGHEYTPENTRYQREKRTGGSTRYCQACELERRRTPEYRAYHRERARRRRAARKEQR